MGCPAPQGCGLNRDGKGKGRRRLNGPEGRTVGETRG